MVTEKEIESKVKKSRKYGYEIKALWIYHNILYILTSKKINKSKEESLKDKFKKQGARETKVLLINEFFRKVMEYNTKLLVSIRDSKTIYDALDIVKVIETNIRKGLMMGTKEVLLRKFMTIRGNIKEIENAKIEVFDNIYMSTLEAAQSALMKKGRAILIPKEVPKLLKKYLLRKGLERTHLRYCKEIINTFKAYEHKTISLPSGPKLDDLARKAELFREAVKKL